MAKRSRSPGPQEGQEERGRRHRHVHASFNNTIVTITDRQGNALSWATSGGAGFKGSRKSHAVRRAGRRRAGRPRGAGVRREEPRSAHQGPRPGPRIRGARAERAGLQDHQHRGRDAGAAQRLPPAQEAAGSNGARTTTVARNLDAKCRQCRREGEKLFLKGEKCFTDKCAIERRSYAPGQHGQKTDAPVRTTACSCARSRRCAASTACSSASSATIYDEGRPRKGHHRREPAADAREPPGQRRLSHGLRRLAHRSAPDRAPQRHLVNGKRVNIPSYLLRPGDVVEVREKAQGAAAHQGRARSWPSSAASRMDRGRRRRHFKGTFKALPQRSDLPPTINESAGGRAVLEVIDPMSRSSLPQPMAEVPRMQSNATIS